MRQALIIMLLLLPFVFVFSLHYTTYKIDLMLGVKNPGLIRVASDAANEIVITVKDTSLPLPVQKEELKEFYSGFSETAGKLAQIARNAKDMGYQAATNLKGAVRRTLEEVQNIVQNYWSFLVQLPAGG
jgi:hypothetical protein